MNVKRLTRGRIIVWDTAIPSRDSYTPPRRSRRALTCMRCNAAQSRGAPFGRRVPVNGRPLPGSRHATLDARVAGAVEASSESRSPRVRSPAVPASGVPQSPRSESRSPRRSESRSPRRSESRSPRFWYLVVEDQRASSDPKAQLEPSHGLPSMWCLHAQF